MSSARGATRLWITLFTIAGSFGVVGSSPASAQDKYPSKPIRWIVGFPAGGGSDLEERRRLVADLADHPVMILRNHGLLVVGRTVPEAFSILHHLEKAAQAQFLAMSTGAELCCPPDLGKDVDQSSVASEIVPMPRKVLDNGAIELSVNGEVKQKSDLDKLIWNVREIIADLSLFYRLQPGDLIYTGTPEGVGAVQPGDRIAGRVEGVGTIEVTVGEGAQG